MANVGERLTSPEVGMKRIDDTNINIKYDGNLISYSSTNSTVYYNNTVHYNWNTSDGTIGEVIFYFYGEKIQIMCGYVASFAYGNHTVYIDDTEVGSIYKLQEVNAQILAFQKLDLDKKIHKVVINFNGVFGLDCIDIDEDGYMIYCDDNGKLYYDVTPIMTSDTTPSPYVVSVSSNANSNTYKNYYAFNGSVLDSQDCWVCTYTDLTPWIQLYFDRAVRINSFSITSRAVGANLQAPRNFQLLGSNDGVDFVSLKSFTGISDWNNSETKYFHLNGVETYKYYRLQITATVGTMGISGEQPFIGELRFLLDTDTPFYLIKDNTDNKIYNYDEENNTLVEVTDTSILKADALNNACIYDLNKVLPLLDTLSDDLTLLCNNDKKIITKGLKSNLELIISKQTLSANIAHLIRELEVICTLVGNGNIKVIVSRDKGSTWSYWDTTTNAWLNLANTVTKRDYNSMTDEEKERWEALKQEAWQYGMTPDIVKIADFESIKDNGFKFAFVLSRPTYEDNAVLKELDWNYDEDGGYIVLNNTDILIKKTDKYIKLVPQRNMENIKVEIVN